MLGSIGGLEIAVIVGLVLIIFGPSQIPKLGRSIGQSIREFKNVKKELLNDVNEVKRAIDE